MKRNVIAALLLAAATFMAVGCTEKENVQPITNTPETPEAEGDTVRVAYIQLNADYDTIALEANSQMTWENGLLMRTVNTITMNGIPAVSLDERLVYENGNCTEMYSTDGFFHHYFTYENNKLKKVLTVENGDTTYVTEVLEWDADGHITKAKYQGDNLLKYAYYTWRNDDMTQVIFEYVEPEVSRDTVTYVYDNYPSVYTGYPMPLNIESLEYMTRASKHNVKSANRTMNYENGRLVSEISNDDHTQRYYTYTDGTGRRD